MCAPVQIPVPCSDNIVKLVTVEQSCRVITGSLFRECNGEVSCITAFGLTAPHVRFPAHPLFSLRARVNSGRRRAVRGDVRGGSVLLSVSGRLRLFL